jgi:hypothetical protein
MFSQADILLIVPLSSSKHLLHIFFIPHRQFIPPLTLLIIFKGVTKELLKKEQERNWNNKPLVCLTELRRAILLISQTVEHLRMNNES